MPWQIFFIFYDCKRVIWGSVCFLKSKIWGAPVLERGQEVLVRWRKEDTPNHTTICCRIKTFKKKVMWLEV